LNPQAERGRSTGDHTKPGLPGRGLQPPATQGFKPPGNLATALGCAMACALLTGFDRLVTPDAVGAHGSALWWLAGGVALVAVWYRGPAGVLGVAGGLALVLLAMTLMQVAGDGGVASPVPRATIEAAGALLAAVAVALLLWRRPLPAPLSSAPALLTLLALVLLVQAPLTAVAGWLAAPEARSAVGLLRAWCWVAVGALLSALPMLAAAGATAPAGHRAAALAAGLTALAAIALTLAFGADGSAAFGIVALALLALQMSAGITLSASALLVCAMLLAAGTAAGLGPWAGDENAWRLALNLAWVTLALLLLELTASQRGRRWRRFATALDGIGIGVAEWSRDSRHPVVTGAWQALAPGSDSGDWHAGRFLAQVHPDDRERLRQALQHAREGTDGAGFGERQEIRLALDAGWRWVESTVVGVDADAQGRPQRLLATLTDIGERREAMERQRLSVALFQHLHEGLLITDGELRVLDANPAYSSILGVPRAELLGSVPSLLRASPVDPLARQQRAAMWAALRDSGQWRGELVERRRSGELCTLMTTASTVQGSGEDLRYHVLVISDVTEQRLQRDRLERQAHFDELTRLPNRARLQQLLADALRAADRDGYLLTVCYLDLDRFKPVNDRFGHAAGDRLLAELAGRLRSALRSRELWADAAARLGGDEFVLLLRAGTVDEARMAVERVMRVVSQPYVVDAEQDPVHVTASVGATIYPIDHSDPDTLLRHADHAMYGAKQAGRNGYLFFDPEHRRQSEQRALVLGRVQEALDRAELLLYYQPKVDMKSGRVLGLEALLRWDHPEQGLVAPMQFLPQIENTGLSARVGDWVFSQALEHLEQWRRSGLDISVSVNVSARHLQERDFAQRLSELLARHAEPLAPWLELEMLETAAHADIDATSALMARCRALGVRFALDDFGTGYSTLTYLKRLPVEVLKIDRSFVHHMLDDAQDRAIVEGVIGLARTFGCTVVAEGVESPAQARMLLELGCEIGQGTGIASPMPSAQVAAWVRDWKGMFTLGPAGPGDKGHEARLAG